MNSSFPSLLPRFRNRGGFSLIELLAVMAIVGVLIGLAVPAVSSLVMGSNLNRAGQIVGDQFTLARQEAVAKNREVEIRFFELPAGSAKQIRAVQLWRIQETPTGTVTNALGRMQVFPENIVANPAPDLSPLLATAVVRGTTNLAGYGNVSYQGFRFRANGSVDNSITVSNNFLTLQQGGAPGAPPANYYTIQVHPVTGRVTAYRP